MKRKRWLCAVAGLLLWNGVTPVSHTSPGGLSGLTADAAAVPEGAPAGVPCGIAGPAVEIPQKIFAMLEQRKRVVEQKEAEIRETQVRLAAIKSEIEQMLARYEQTAKVAEELRKKADAEGRQADLDRLAKIYESMPAEEAALRLERMPVAKALHLLRNLNGRTAGAILAHVQPAKAAKLTEQLLPKP